MAMSGIADFQNSGPSEYRAFGIADLNPRFIINDLLCRPSGGGERPSVLSVVEHSRCVI